MQVVQAVFGVFHHFELAHQLHGRGHLRKVYSTWPWARLKREGLPHALVGTFPYLHLADYLLGQTRFYPKPLSIEVQRLTTLSFDEYTRRVIPSCDAFIGISGAGLLTGQLVQRRGGRFVCDRGSTHQRFQDEVNDAEYKRWNVPLPPPVPHIALREEQIYAVADAITVPSSVARRSFLHMGIAPEKVHVIPYGVRLDRFVRPEGVAPPADSFEVLFAGQVALRKGIPYLLEAFARLRHPNKRLTVVGAMHQHMRPLLRELPTDHVTFTGSLPQAELVERMSRSHVLVLPSVEEGLALVQAQAMACQCPVIATEATGAEDLFTDGVEGFIVPNRDVDALADRLQRVADDSALQARLAQAALTRVRSIGGWDTYGDAWESLLRTLVRPGREAGTEDPTVARGYKG
jgi:glycosyltransferase involved in cell wall biosynthesis